MDELVNTMDPKHGHEPGAPVVKDRSGSCLVCKATYAAEELARGVLAHEQRGDDAVALLREAATDPHANYTTGWKERADAFLAKFGDSRMSDAAKPNLRDMIDELTAAGYLVFKADECTRMDRPHGGHVLTTRSAICEGKEPIPHGYQNSHLGSFGMWMNCLCGRSFSDYSFNEPPEPTNWEQHKKEHSIA